MRNRDYDPGRDITNSADIVVMLRNGYGAGRRAF